MNGRRASRYERIYEQLRGLIEGSSPSLQAAMSTICAVLHAKMPHHSWTGFYIAKGRDELHVGPYQGPVACQTLRGGVCVDAMRSRSPIVVPDVDQYPGHVACDSRSKSEIAVPVMRGDDVAAIFDVDSWDPAQFAEADVAPIARILALLDPFLPR